MDAVVAAPPQFSAQMTGCRGGDRASNNALHRMALVRISADKRTRDYMDRQQAHGRSKMEILHVLKRALAREALRLLTQPCAVNDCSELRPSRQHKNIAVTTVFQHFGVWPPSSPTSNEDSNETTSSSRPTTNGLRGRDRNPYSDRSIKNQCGLRSEARSSWLEALAGLAQKSSSFLQPSGLGPGEL